MAVDIKRAVSWLKLAKAVETTGGKWASTDVFNKRWQIGRLLLKARMRRSDGMMGRFGGGWNFKLGIQGGSRTWIISLCVMDITIYWAPPREGAEQTTGAGGDR